MFAAWLFVVLGILGKWSILILGMAASKIASVLVILVLLAVFELETLLCILRFSIKPELDFGEELVPGLGEVNAPEELETPEDTLNPELDLNEGLIICRLRPLPEALEDLSVLEVVDEAELFCPSELERDLFLDLNSDMVKEGLVLVTVNFKVPPEMGFMVN